MGKMKDLLGDAPFATSDEGQDTLRAVIIGAKYEAYAEEGVMPTLEEAATDVEMLVKTILRLAGR